MSNFGGMYLMEFGKKVILGASGHLDLEGSNPDSHLSGPKKHKHIGIQWSMLNLARATQDIWKSNKTRGIFKG